SQQRLNYWKGGWEMLNDHPLLGVGYYNFPPYFNEHYRDLVLYEHAQLPHNILVQVGADLGYLGLFVYAMLILNCFIRKKAGIGREAQDDLIGTLPWVLNISILGFLIAGQFVSVVYYPYMWIHLAFVGIVRNIISNQSPFGSS